MLAAERVRGFQLFNVLTLQIAISCNKKVRKKRYLSGKIFI